MTPLSEPRDRLTAVTHSTVINGIDYVEIIPNIVNQVRVHFLNIVQPLKSLAATITGGDVVPTVTVGVINPADWSHDPDGRPLLTLNLLNVPQGVADFSTYTLTLAAVTAGQPTLLDPQYTSIGFSFKALCPSAFDCAAPASTCPPDDTIPPAIDYTAKDFGSFVQALSAFAAQAYPNWQERSEADLGVVIMEALAAVADELSYYQDRVAAEATIATATQRRSIVSLARLVDYEPSPVQSAQTTLLCNVTSVAIPAGALVSAVGPDGTVIAFEIGVGLNDTTNYPVSPGWNFPIQAYYWDDSERCLPAGATQMWVLGDAHGFVKDMQVLIQTDVPGEKSLRQIVTLTVAGETAEDAIFTLNGSPTPVTLITWGASDALTEERNLVFTNVGGNLLPATQGQRYAEAFAIDTPPADQPGMVLAIARRGPNGTDANPHWIYRRPLANSPVAWLPPPPAVAANPLVADNALAPEIILTPLNGASWTFAQSLLIAAETETAFTIDPVAWRAVVTNPDGTVANYDMDGDGGESIRFGDNVFGVTPQSGEIFNLLYRVSLGAAGNVPADSITVVDPNWGGLISSATNPMAATGGADAEAAIHVQRMAPQRFRAIQLRAVHPEDYVAAAETLPWVKQAGCAFRWTGSWLSVFTVADPGGAETITPDQQVALSELLNRRKLAGYESFAPPPDYVSLDLAVDVCAAAVAFGPDVEQAVLAALGATDLTAPGATAFFANRFSFGTPLYRSALEAAVQAVPGVSGVLGISFRQRGVTVDWLDMPAVFPLGANQILRIDNNPDYPERGTIQVTAEGGR